MAPLRGRGTSENPLNRFEQIGVVPDPDDPERPDPGTRFFRDSSRSLITRNESPDIGFETSLNPYRGCEHGCIYCYARPYHEYLGLSAGLDFETRIFVKEDAPRLLREELSSARWTPQVIAIAGVTDAYQPVERTLKLTRACIEVLAEFRNPVHIVTKSHLVTRDVDLLSKLAQNGAASVMLSITTLDPELAGELEPRASSPERRLAALRELAQAGIPCGVLVSPIIPGLTDHEMPRILEAAAGAGASSAGYQIVRLPYGVKDLFVRWLTEHRPNMKRKVIHRIREMSGGRMNDPRFHLRMSGTGVMARQIRDLFRASCTRLGYPMEGPELSTTAFRRPGGQLELFD